MNISHTSLLSTKLKHNFKIAQFVKSVFFFGSLEKWRMLQLNPLKGESSGAGFFAPYSPIFPINWVVFSITY